MIRRSRRGPVDPIHGHLSHSRLAFVASGGVPHSDEEVHLASCRRCTAVYAELVRVRAEELSQRSVAPGEILADGHAFVVARTTSFALRRSRRPWFVFAPSLALAALLLFMVIRGPVETGMPSAELPDVVRQALVEQSSNGMWHPLVADAQLVELPVLRGGGQDPDGMDAVLDELTAELAADPNSARASAALIAGFQAAGQSRNARAYLEVALEQNPRDDELRMLEIVQDYREGKLPVAEKALRQRVAQDPKDTLAQLNLAILLNARGDAEGRQEARALAEALAADSPESGFGQRARKILG